MAKANISCGNCFYSFNGTNIQPCLTCYMYDKWVPHDIYKEDEDVEEKMRITPSAVHLTPIKEGYDNVEKPKHYMLFEDKGIEVRDVVERLLEKLHGSNIVDAEPIVFSDYAQALQYVMRFMDKGGVEDLKKAIWYFNKMIESLQK